ncbi:MAG: hypothetical protein IPO66_11905 [Rhodanobacteraceae bacterium]|nr:hypothetical protein [Rhodanobacteraceae bacterium]
MLPLLRYRHDACDRNSLSDNDIDLALYQDRGGTLWAGIHRRRQLSRSQQRRLERIVGLVNDDDARGDANKVYARVAPDGGEFLVRHTGAVACCGSITAAPRSRSIATILVIRSACRNDNARGARRRPKVQLAGIDAGLRVSRCVRAISHPSLANPGPTLDLIRTDPTERNGILWLLAAKAASHRYDPQSDTVYVASAATTPLIPAA